MLKMLHAIQDKLGIECEDPEGLADLELNTDPQDVLTEIERLRKRQVP